MSDSGKSVNYKCLPGNVGISGYRIVYKVVKEELSLPGRVLALSEFARPLKENIHKEW